jgi:hypothetical protein
MNSPKKDRFSKATFAILIAFVVWGLIGLVLHPIEVTSFWGVGLGAVAAVLFVLAMDIKNFGLKNGALVFITIAVVTFGAVMLNHLRGWPFGLLSYHDILGWKILGGIAWPIPAFWVFVSNAAFLLMRPKEMRYDVKLLFSWAFDTGLTVMLAALIIEPIMTDHHGHAHLMLYRLVPDGLRGRFRGHTSDQTLVARELPGAALSDVRHVWTKPTWFWRRHPPDPGPGPTLMSGFHGVFRVVIQKGIQTT